MVRPVLKDFAIIKTIFDVCRKNNHGPPYEISYFYLNNLSDLKRNMSLNRFKHF